MAINNALRKFGRPTRAKRSARPRAARDRRGGLRRLQLSRVCPSARARRDVLPGLRDAAHRGRPGQTRPRVHGGRPGRRHAPGRRGHDRRKWPSGTGHRGRCRGPGRELKRRARCKRGAGAAGRCRHPIEGCLGPASGDRDRTGAWPGTPRSSTAPSRLVAPRASTSRGSCGPCPPMSCSGSASLRRSHRGRRRPISPPISGRSTPRSGTRRRRASRRPSPTRPRTSWPPSGWPNSSRGLPALDARAAEIVAAANLAPLAP